MVITDQFSLLKGVPNILDLSSSTISRYSINADIKNMTQHLQIIEKQINHFSKDLVMREFSNLADAEKKVHVLNISKYPIPISYNRPTKKIVINLSAFNLDEISRLDGKTIFGSLSYGLCLERLVTGKKKIKTEDFGIITSFLTTVLIRVFGKEYGLLGIYSTKIPKLKFLLACYILGTFFGETRNVAYKKAYVLSPYDYKENIRELSKYSFTNIEDLVKSMSDFKVMPGLSKYNFTAKILRFLGINFLPAFEDLSRFMATILVSNIGGANIIPSFIFTYNQTEFAKLLEILKKVMR